jgi:hypothetical protein
MSQGSWLRIEGTLTRNGWQFTPKPGHEAGRIPSEFTAELEAQEANPVEAILVDTAGEVVARAKPRLRRRACGADSASAAVQVAAYLPLLSKGAAYEVRNGGVTLYRAAIPEAAPSVRITRCTLDGDTVTAAWSAQAAGGANLHFRVACILGNRTFPLATLLNQYILKASLANVPGPGDAYISVMASDGVRAAVALSDKFSLPARPPVLTVLSPANRASYGFHEPIALQGAVMDTGGRTLPDQGIEWLCDGQVVARDARSALLTSASPGQHRITLSADGAQASVSVTVRDQTPSEREWAAIFGVQR